MTHREFIDDNKAVSPIIGTILMVAITVIMAAIIANWSSGIKAPETPKSVGLDVSRLTEKNVTITITSIDPPQTVVSSLNATFKSGNNSQTVRRAILGSGAPDSNGFTGTVGGTTGTTFIPDIKTNYANGTAFPSQANVGDSVTIYISGYGEFLVITAAFGDGSVKTLYSQKV